MCEPIVSLVCVAATHRVFAMKTMCQSPPPPPPPPWQTHTHKHTHTQPNYEELEEELEEDEEAEKEREEECEKPAKSKCFLFHLICCNCGLTYCHFLSCHPWSADLSSPSFLIFYSSLCFNCFLKNIDRKTCKFLFEKLPDFFREFPAGEIPVIGKIYEVQQTVDRLSINVKSTMEKRRGEKIKINESMLDRTNHPSIVSRDEGLNNKRTESMTARQTARKKEKSHKKTHTQTSSSCFLLSRLDISCCSPSLYALSKWNNETHKQARAEKERAPLGCSRCMRFMFEDRSVFLSSRWTWCWWVSERESCGNNCSDCEFVVQDTLSLFLFRTSWVATFLLILISINQHMGGGGGGGGPPIKGSKQPGNEEGSGPETDGR